MTPEEAALQLELVGHDFFVFTNSETQRDGGGVSPPGRQLRADRGADLSRTAAARPAGSLAGGVRDPASATSRHGVIDDQGR